MVLRAPVTVRRAVAEDFGALAATLARAFHDDPVTAFFYPDAERRPAHARRFFHIRLRQLEPQRAIYTTPDRTGAALWAEPGRWREDLRQALMLLPMLPALLPHLRSAARAVREIEVRHPERPHYYLSVLGTEPAQQGGGIGSALLGPVLERCDAAGMPAYLESSRETNVSFYARHGFEVTERMQLPDGPPLWLMWREPHPRTGPSSSP
jgi:GNAT superfamily N-acetyltransferase